MTTNSLHCVTGSLGWLLVSTCLWLSQRAVPEQNLVGIPPVSPASPLSLLCPASSGSLICISATSKLFIVTFVIHSNLSSSRFLLSAHSLRYQDCNCGWLSPNRLLNKCPLTCGAHSRDFSCRQVCGAPD